LDAATQTANYSGQFVQTPILMVRREGGREAGKGEEKGGKDRRKQGRRERRRSRYIEMHEFLSIR